MTERKVKPEVGGKTSKHCQIIFKVFLKFTFHKGHTNISSWKFKKILKAKRFMALVSIFGMFSLRCFFFLSRLVNLSMCHENLFLSLSGIEFLSGNVNYDISLAEKDSHL